LIERYAAASTRLLEFTQQSWRYIEREARQMIGDRRGSWVFMVTPRLVTPTEERVGGAIMYTPASQGSDIGPARFVGALCRASRDATVVRDGCTRDGTARPRTTRSTGPR
jgi:hypothetical protein